MGIVNVRLLGVSTLIKEGRGGGSRTQGAGTELFPIGVGREVVEPSKRHVLKRNS